MKMPPLQDKRKRSPRIARRQVLYEGWNPLPKIETRSVGGGFLAALLPKRMFWRFVTEKPGSLLISSG